VRSETFYLMGPVGATSSGGEQTHDAFDKCAFTVSSVLNGRSMRGRGTDECRAEVVRSEQCQAVAKDAVGGARAAQNTCLVKVLQCGMFSAHQKVMVMRHKRQLRAQQRASQEMPLRARPANV